MRHLFAVLGCVALLSVVAVVPGLPVFAGDETVDFAADDAAMNAAIAQAQASLPDFVARAGQADLSAGAYLVKWAYPLDGGANEHIWVSVTAVDPAGFAGQLANNPNAFAGAAGDAVHVPMAQVSDWSFWDENGLLHGSYTTRVMLPQMTEEDRARLSAILAPLPE